jgi:hypothetical protein
MSPATDSRRRRHILAALESLYARDLGRRSREGSRAAHHQRPIAPAINDRYGRQATGRRVGESCSG